jgi:hypothetical protein
MSTAMWLDTTSWMRGSMPLVPPELARPYASQADKEADWQRLLQRAEALKELTELADIPESQWPAGVASKMRAAPPIASETAAQRLIRWRSFFVSELADLERAVVVAASQGTATTVPGIDLRSAVYLAGRLLASLYGSPVGEVAP